MKPTKNLDELLAENLALREAVTVRTIELAQKNRELEIEHALERVRARTITMQQSAELQGIVNALFENLTSLGIHMDTGAILNHNKETHNTEAWIQNAAQTFTTVHVIPFNKESRISRDSVDFMEKGEGLFVMTYPKEDKDVWFKWLFETGLKHLPPERKEFVLNGTHQASCLAKTGNGGIYVARYYDDNFTSEEQEIISRFVTVFNEAYVRFLDLQKVEAQAREAQIEASLERVRAKAMAMQSSEDLQDAVALVFEELEKLNLGVLRVGISVLNAENRCGNVWLTSIDEGKAVQVYGDESFDIHPLLKGAMDAWLKREDFYYELEGEDLVNYYRAVGEARFRLPDSQMLTDGLTGKKQSCFVAVYNSGGLFAFREGEFPKEARHVMRRFASVFDLTYKRFLDLQQAEALAKQAEIDLINLKEEKKRTEEALTELKNTQKQLVQAEKMASLGELTAGIAHEIQNPLNFVNNFSEVSTELITELIDAVDKNNNEEVKAIADDLRQNLEKINHHGKRADGIVKGMLQHSRSSAATKEPTDLNKLADEYLRLAYHGLRARDKSFNANIQSDFDQSLDRINVIPQDIGRVILNLITNAFYVVGEKKKRSASSYEPTVIVSTRKNGAYAELSVTDNGNGIPENILDKIFQPFFTTKPTGQGTGLGLSLSYDIMKAHNGELKVETKEGEGATFTICLPLTSF